MSDKNKESKKYNDAVIVFKIAVDELKQFFTSYFFYFLLAFFCFFVGLGVKNNLETADFLNTVYCSQYVQMFAIGIFIIFGLQMSGKDAQSSADEFMPAIHKCGFYKACARILAIDVLALLYFAVYSLILFISGLIMSAPLALIGHGLLFLTLRTFLPMVIVGVLGLCIGQQIRRPSKYALALVIWLFITPIFSFVKDYLFMALDALNINLYLAQYCLGLISLGTPIFHDSASVYGFDMELPRWIHVFIYLLFAVVLYVSLNLVASKRKKLRCASKMVTGGVLVCALAVLLASYNEKTMLLFDYSTYNLSKLSEYDLDYYHSNYDSTEKGNMINYSIIPDFPREVSMKLKECDVELSTDSLNAYVKASLKAEVISPSQSQVFTLYRNFKVSSIEVNGADAEYTQSGDYVLVEMPEGLSVGDELLIEFSYGGMSSPMAPANNTMVCLTSNFPWLPSFGMTVPPEHTRFMGTNAIALYTSQTNTEVNYTLSYKSEYCTYTNVGEQKDGVYSGISDTGLTVISYPMQKVSVVDGSTVYYPLSIQDRLPVFVSAIQKLNGERDKFFKALNCDKYSGISCERIIIVPKYADNIIGSINELLLLDKDTAVYIDNAYSIDSMYRVCLSINNSEYDSDVISSVDRSVLSAPQVYQAGEYSYVNLFIKEYLSKWYWVNHQTELSVESVNFDSALEECCDFLYGNEELEREKSTYYTDEYRALNQNICTKIEELMVKNEDEKLAAFFGDWYSDLTNGNYWSVEQVAEKLELE